MNFTVLAEKINFTRNKFLVVTAITLFLSFLSRYFFGTFLTICYLMGQLAFPMMCYLFVESLLTTKHTGRFFCLLAVLCVIAEIPYDFITYHSFSLESNNMLWGFLLAGVAVLVNRELNRYRKGKGVAFSVLAVVLTLCTIGITFYLAYLLKPSFGVIGVLAPVFMALSRKWGNVSLVFPPLLFSIIGGMPALFSLFYFIPVKLYNKKRGSEKLAKGLFLLYPVELYIILLIKIIM